MAAALSEAQAIPEQAPLEGSAAPAVALVEPMVWRQLVLLLSGWLALGLGSNWQLDDRGYNLSTLIPGVDRGDLTLAYAAIAGQEDVFMIGSSRVRDGIVAAQAERLLQQLLIESAPPTPVDSNSDAGEEPAPQAGYRFYKLGLRGVRPPLICDIIESITSVHPPKRLLVIAVEERFFALRRSASAGDPTGEFASRKRRQSDWPWRGLGGLASLGRRLDPVFREQQAAVQSRSGDYNTLETWNEAPGDVLEGELPQFEAGGFPKDTRWHWQSPESNDFQAWENLWDLLAKLPCQVIFVRMPIQGTFLRTQRGEVERNFQRHIVPEIEARGYRFFDLAKAPYPIEPGDYQNSNHLNLDGAQRCTQLFCERVLVPLLSR
jgi:hypothetical protein